MPLGQGHVDQDEPTALGLDEPAQIAKLVELLVVQPVARRN